MKRLAIWRWFVVLLVGIVWLFGSPVLADDAPGLFGNESENATGEQGSATNQIKDEGTDGGVSETSDENDGSTGSGSAGDSTGEEQDAADESDKPKTDDQFGEDGQSDEDSQSEPPVVEVYSPKFGDLQVIKIQLRDRNYPDSNFEKAQELIVVKNTTSEEINLNGWQFEVIDKNGVNKIKVEINQGAVLKPGEMVYFVNGHLNQEFLAEVDQNFIFEFGKVKAGKLPKSFGIIRLISDQKTEILNTSYSNQDQVGDIYLASDKDFASWVVDQAGDVVVDADGQPIFEQFDARRPKLVIWLPINALPIQEPPPEDEPEPPIVDKDVDEDSEPKVVICADGYEIGFTGTCVKVCGSGYFRNPETNRCNKIKDDVEEIKTCPEGYWLNPATNRCNKIEVPTVKTCPAGYWLNPETNRCNKIQIASALAPCPVGYERNPATNRCRKISNQQECDDGYEIGFTGTCVKACAEGYERNPETNRCRKVVAFASDTDIDGAISATTDSEAPNTVKLKWQHAVLIAGGGLVAVAISRRQTIADLLKHRSGK